MSKVKLKIILEKLLKDKGISARELSRRTGIPQSTINNFLSGRGSHKPEQILILSKYFGTTMEYLLFGEDTRQPSLDEVLVEGIFEGWLKVKIERAIPNKRKG
jgi:transcriptional regulator with XRE-family HTH domain